MTFRNCQDWVDPTMFAGHTGSASPAPRSSTFWHRSRSGSDRTASSADYCQAGWWPEWLAMIAYYSVPCRSKGAVMAELPS